MKPFLIVLALIAAWPADACPRHRAAGEYRVKALACDPVSKRCVHAWRRFTDPKWH